MCVCSATNVLRARRRRLKRPLGPALLPSSGLLNNLYFPTREVPLNLSQAGGNRLLTPLLPRPPPTGIVQFSMGIEEGVVANPTAVVGVAAFSTSLLVFVTTKSARSHIEAVVACCCERTAQRQLFGLFLVCMSDVCRVRPVRLCPALALSKPWQLVVAAFVYMFGLTRNMQ